MHQQRDQVEYDCERFARCSNIVNLAICSKRGRQRMKSTQDHDDCLSTSQRPPAQQEVPSRKEGQSALNLGIKGARPSR